MGQASPLLQAGTQIMAGRAQAKQLGMENLMLQRQAKDVDLQALQASGRRREELRAGIAAWTANRSAKGLSLDSPSGMAIERELRRQSVRDEGAENLGFKNQGYALRTSAAMRRRAASNANASGWLAAGGTIMDAAANAFSAGAGGAGAGSAAGGAKSIARYDYGGSGRIGTTAIYGTGKGGR